MALDSYSGIPELSGEANAIARRRKIAEMMMAQSQEQLPVNQMAGQVVAPVSWTQGLAKLANAYLGKRQADEADKSEQGLANKRQQMVADAIAKLNQTAQGTPAIDGVEAQPERTIQAPAPMQPNQVAPNYGTVPETVPAVAGRAAVPAVAGDKRKAIIEAVMSNLPEVQKYAGAMQSFEEMDSKYEDKEAARLAAQEQKKLDREAKMEQIKTQIESREMMGQQTNDLRAAMANLQAETRRDIAEQASADRRMIASMASADRRASAGGGGGHAYSVPVQTADGVYAFDTRSKTMTKMSDDKGNPIIGSTSDVNLKKGLSSASEEGKLLGKDRGNIASKEDAMSSLTNAKNLLKEGIYTGGYAEAKSNISKYSPLGDKKKLERTQAFVSEIGNTVVPRLQEFGGNDSNEELKYLKGIMGGEITLEKGALERVLNSSEAKIRRGIDRVKKGQPTNGAATGGVVEYVRDANGKLRPK